jgi:NAD(P)H-flavin reductase
MLAAAGQHEAAEEADRRPLAVLGRDNAAYREEMEPLRARLDLKLVHVLEEPPEGWEGARGRITRELLERHLPADVRGRMH